MSGVYYYPNDKIIGVDENNGITTTSSHRRVPCSLTKNDARLFIIIIRAFSLSIVKHGVSPEDASYFVGRSYLSMVQDAERNCRDSKRFDDLIEEQTPGGLNEQVSLLLSR